MKHIDRPVVGVSILRETVARDDWPPRPNAMIAMTYLEHLEAAGAIPLLIPPRVDQDADMSRQILERLDGLVLTGGADVEPRWYGRLPDPTVTLTRPDRDSTDLALARVAVQMDLPLLGICRGMQVMAIAAGGDLTQHLPDVVHTDIHGPLATGYGLHAVDLVDGSVLRSMQDTRMDVPTHHHQAVATHPGYDAVARADDGTIEAIEDQSATFRVGVQWHPEASTDSRLFAGLVEASRTAAHAVSA